MSDLVEFLRARLDEDEDRAKRAAFGWGPEWRHERDDVEDWSVVHASGKLDMIGCEDGDVTEHIAHWDPARVLAEVAAKRAIVDAYVLRDQQGQMPGGEVIGYHATGVRTALRHLGAVYADHPDYREEWRP